MADFLEDWVEFWPKYVHHNDVHKWQNDDRKHIISNLPRGFVETVEDFAENYSIEMMREFQSKYWSQVSATLYGVMLVGHVEDFKDDFFEGGNETRQKI